MKFIYVCTYKNKKPDFTLNLKDSAYCNCLYFSISALNREFTRLADEEFAETGLSASHAFVLMNINSNPGKGPSEIAREMLLQPSTVTRFIDKLVLMQLVEKKSNGKYMQIYPTTKGKEKDMRVRKAWENLSKRYTRKLGEKFSSTFTTEVHEVYENIKIT